MTIIQEMPLSQFDFWSGAKDRAKYLTSDELDTIESILAEQYPNGCSDTTVNDIFWFEDDWLAELLGYSSFDEIMEERDYDL